MAEKSKRGGEKTSTRWLVPEPTASLVCSDGGGITVTAGAKTFSCSSGRQFALFVVQGQRMWCTYCPASTIEHCSKSSCLCGDILAGSRGPSFGSMKLTMNVVHR